MLVKKLTTELLIPEHWHIAIHAAQCQKRRLLKIDFQQPAFC
jgi:hypothetical protein